MTFSTTPPPGSFGTGDLYTSPLRVYYQGGRIWVYDREGFLCSTDSTDDLLELLVAEAQKHPNLPNRRYFWPKAREQVHPGSAEAYEKKLQEAEAYNDAFVRSQAAKRESTKTGKVTPPTLSTAELLAKLGLSQ